ncbi:cofilin/actin-depolymerizing factor homolog [Lytechinus variegatus]|uniref:cofilin/actin-depolymerizing factor homolog n=1 Tax=Lytechinus variegatus TaxID=7654 RepID=UPI001BB26561|nr:cofilin/actin-depolymerizing factor homolog [Lytechinus variegatus]
MPKSGITVPAEIEKIMKDLVKKQYIYAIFELCEEGNSMAWKRLVERQKRDAFPDIKSHDRAPRERFEREYDQFLSYIKPDNALVGLFDFSALEVPGKDLKIAEIHWCKDEMPVKKKMLFASSVDDVKKCCSGSAKIINIKEIEELNIDAIIDLVKS